MRFFKRVFSLLIVLQLLLLMLSQTIALANDSNTNLIPAFPGAEGGGMYATGGRGGDVYEVTTLADSGPGSLREGVKRSNCTIVFRVSGTIFLKSPLDISGSNLTIAGQTAPGDGITIAGDQVTISGDNIIMRFLRIRCGTKIGSEPDALNNNKNKNPPQRNLIIDHCSISWAVDETCSIYNVEDSTLQWCIISESLTMSTHSKGRHGYGGIWGGKNTTYHHNLIAHHSSRTPRFSAGESTDFRNNVIYNWGFNNIYGANNAYGPGGDVKINIINNYYKPGPSTQKEVETRIFGPSLSADGTAGSFYIAGNYVYGHPEATNDNWGVGVQVDDPSYWQKITKLTQPVNVANPPLTDSAEEAFKKVIKYAGAILPKRDYVDARIVEDVVYGRGRLINQESEVGGWPEMRSEEPPADSDHDGMSDWWEISKGLDPLDPADSKKDSGDGYTNLEKYLNWIVEEGIKNLEENPRIELESPYNNACFKAGDTILIRANATASQGKKIKKVEFYYNTTKIGESYFAPYEIKWTNVPEGTYYVHAIAEDTHGYRSQSNIVQVHINKENKISPWLSKDIGNTTIPVTVYKEDENSLTVNGCGKIGDREDSFAFVYQPVAGNFDIQAKVEKITPIDIEAVGGLMIREGLSNNDKFVLISLSYVKADANAGETGIAVRGIVRNNKGGLAGTVASYNFAEIPYWLRITRDSGYIKLLYSNNGIDWKVLTQIADTFSQNVYVGIAVDSAKDSSKTSNYNRVKMIGLKLDKYDENIVLNNAQTEYTNKDSYTVSGTVKKSGTLQVSVAESVYSNLQVVAGQSFEINVPLNSDVQEIKVKLYDLNNSLIEEKGIVVYKDTEVLKDKEIAVPTNTVLEKVYKGYVVAGEDLTFVLKVNNATVHYKKLNENERFDFDVPLAPGINNIELVEIDKAGNSKTLSKDVLYLTKPTLVVAKDGTGDFTSVQSALSSISKQPTNENERIVIFVKNGIYKEKVRVTIPYVTIVGEDRDSTIITFDDHVDVTRADNSDHPTVIISAPNFIAANITFENTSGQIERANAVCINKTDRAIFYNCKITSGQDTLYLNTSGRAYFKKCIIEGDVDYIYGGATAYFEDCEIVQVVHGGYVTAASTPLETPFGFVFVNCKLTYRDMEVNPVASTYLGRPWREYAAVTYINCWMDVHIKPEGWHNWGDPNKEKTARYSEYNSQGPGANPDARVKWARQLTEVEAAVYTIDNVLGGSDKWNPEEIVDNVFVPLNIYIGNDDKESINIPEFTLNYSTNIAATVKIILNNTLLKTSENQALEIKNESIRVDATENTVVILATDKFGRQISYIFRIIYTKVLPTVEFITPIPDEVTTNVYDLLFKPNKDNMKITVKLNNQVVLEGVYNKNDVVDVSLLLEEGINMLVIELEDEYEQKNSILNNIRYIIDWGDKTFTISLAGIFDPKGNVLKQLDASKDCVVVSRIKNNAGDSKTGILKVELVDGTNKTLSCASVKFTLLKGEMKNNKTFFKIAGKNNINKSIQIRIYVTDDKGTILSNIVKVN